MLQRLLLAMALAVGLSSDGWSQGQGSPTLLVDERGFPFNASNPLPTGGATGGQKVDTVIQGAAVYRGGTIATANTSQQLMAANPARRGWSVQNQSTGDLYVKVGQAATTNNVSLRIAPGVIYETQSQHTSAGVINIIGATAGAAFYATEY